MSRLILAAHGRALARISREEMDAADPGLESRPESIRDPVRKTHARLKFSYTDYLTPSAFNQRLEGTRYRPDSH